MCPLLCCRSTPRPGLTPTSSRRRCGRSNGAPRGDLQVNEDLTPPTTLYLRSLSRGDSMATVGVVLTKRPELDHVARRLRYAPTTTTPKAPYAAQSLH